MSEEVVSNGGFTTKEMLVRMDGKLDVVAARQQHADVELAMLKERVAQVEASSRRDDLASEQWRAEVRAELAEAKRLAALARDEGTVLGRKLAYATGTLSAIILIANFLVPWILSHI